MTYLSLKGMAMKKALAAVIVSLLLGCGGGGGGGGSAPSVGPVVSTSSFPVVNVQANHINSGYTHTGTITGTVTASGITLPVTGTVTLTVTPAPASTFEGRPALVDSETVSGSITATNPSTGASTTIPFPTTTATQTFSDQATFAPLGSSSAGSYSVMQGTATIPSTAKVGDTGVIGTFTNYTDSSKATTVGTIRISYVVEADTSSTAIFNIITQEFDATNTLVATEQVRWRVDTSGTATFVSNSTTATIPATATSPSLVLTLTIH